MIFLKKLDRYILRQFLLVFVGAFFICLFVFMMQFTWRYVDELIGKGLSMEILAQFFWYMGITLVPQSLPLAVLLASLITFGNMGESLELLSMKAAGVPLIRIMRPLGGVAALLMGVSFYFQNSTSPEAQVNLRTLLFSMKQQSPAVEIPEGVFYSGVPDVNIYVEKKNAATGMLYQTIIYKTDQGFDKTQIVLADSGRLEMTRDKLHLKLDLWDGTQYESLQQSGGARMMQSGAEAPYDRETFRYKQLIIDFDSNFNLMDKDLLAGMPSAKNMRQIEHSVDSMELKMDSVGKEYYRQMRQSYLGAAQLPKADSLRVARAVQKHAVTFDSVVAQFPPDRMQRALGSVRSAVSQAKSDLEWKSMVTSDGDTYIRRHWVEWHQKFTLSLACLIFFFVGAPLGAIIRRGGLGLPTVISVIIFIFWYIINTSGMKMARDGSVPMAAGMWVSTFVTAPFAIFLSYKANHDSAVFNMDAYVSLFRRLLGLRDKRHITRKEVIIDDPHLDMLPAQLSALGQACASYNQAHRLLRAPSYVSIFFHYSPDEAVLEIDRQMEAIIEDLSNSRDTKVLGLLNQFPILWCNAHTTPFHSARLNKIAGIFFPVGGVLWLRIWHFRLRLLRDLRQIERVSLRLQSVLGTLDSDVADSVRAAEERDRQESAAKYRRRHRFKRVVKLLLAAAVLALLGVLVANSVERFRLRRPTAPQEQRTETPSAQPRSPKEENPLKLPERAPRIRM